MIALLSLLLMVVNASAKNCIPAREDVSYPHNGQYHRVSPTGEFVIVTTGAGADIIDLRQRGADGKIEAKVIHTPMANEAAAVEPSWDLIASPYDTKGNDKAMRYYSFDQMVNAKPGDDVKAGFSDRTHDEFYHSTAELPDSTKTKRHVRTTLYSENKTREYTFTMENGKLTGATTLSTYPLCDNIIHPQRNYDRRAYGALSKKADQLDEKMASMRTQLISDLAPNRRNRDRDDYRDRDRGRDRDRRSSYDRDMMFMDSRERRMMENSPRGGTSERYLNQLIAMRISDISLPRPAFDRMLEYMKTNRERAETRAKMEELNPPNTEFFDSPVLSKDGTQVATNYKGTLKVYTIKPDNSCELAYDTKATTSKPVFSYPEKGKEPKLVYTATSGPSTRFERSVIMYDPNQSESNRSKVLSHGPDEYYPGFTKDGRVIVSSTDGFQILDPNQVLHNGECIEVARKAQGGTKSDTNK